MALSIRNAWRRVRIYGIALLIAGAAATLVSAGTASADEVGPPQVPAPSRIDLGGLGSCGIPIHQQAYVEAYGPRSLDGVNVEGGGFLAISYGRCGNNFKIELQVKNCSSRIIYTSCGWKTIASKKFRADELPANGRVTDVVSAPLRLGENSYKVVASATYRTDLTPKITTDETSTNKITRQ
jgi:hypothetical protein